jgi:hypothetical protein
MVLSAFFNTTSLGGDFFLDSRQILPKKRGYHYEIVQARKIKVF